MIEHKIRCILTFSGEKTGFIKIMQTGKNVYIFPQILFLYQQISAVFNQRKNV